MFASLSNAAAQRKPDPPPLPPVARIDRADFPIERMTPTRLRIAGVDEDLVAGMYVHLTIPLLFHDGTFEDVPLEAQIYGKQDGVAALKIEHMSGFARQVIKAWRTEAAEKGVNQPPPPGGAGAADDGDGGGGQEEEAETASS